MIPVFEREFFGHRKGAFTGANPATQNQTVWFVANQKRMTAKEFETMLRPEQLRGFAPFWFWNDRLSATEIRWQVKEMADKGIRGFFIHSRQGLQQPYLSESFFAMVDTAIEAAEEHGLSVHLYDEYPYPSGIAGGEVVLGNPEYAATYLEQRAYRVDGGHVNLTLPKGKVLSCVACPLQNEQAVWAQQRDLLPNVGMVLTTESYRRTGLTQYNRKRYFASEPRPILEVELPAQPYRIYVSVQCELRRFKYWDKGVDVLNAEAVATFINLTHERYRQRYADKFGTRILSIFTDETEPGWSSRIPVDFEAAYGYRLKDALPALHDESHPDYLRVAHDLYTLKYRMFCEAYEGPVSAWCRAHGIAYSGEKPPLRLAQLRYADIPGCDPGHVKVGAKPDMLKGAIRSNARAVASAGYFYNKPGTLCECYHSVGWSATLQDAKYIADNLLLLGISMLVPHGFFYSTHALKKHDAPPSFFFQMPFWPLFGHLSERIEWLQRLFEGTHIAAKILVIDPSSGLPTTQDREAYSKLLWFLMEHHLDFHIVDTDILETGRIVDGVVHLADIGANMVIVPPMSIIEKPLHHWLVDYEEAGGTVINASQADSFENLREAVLKHAQPDLSITIDGHQEASDILAVTRSSVNRTLWFLLHTGKEPVQAQFRGNRELREVSFQHDSPNDFRKDGDHYVRTVAPFESFVLEAADTVTPHAPTPKITVPVTGPATLRCANPNLLRMDLWRMSLMEHNCPGERPEESSMVHATPLMNQLIEGQFRFVPAYEEYFGHVAELSLPELHVRYEYIFQCRYTGPVQLVMEPGSIVGNWRITCNNGTPYTQSDFQPTDAHVRGSLGLDITGELVQGSNSMCIDVVTAQPDGGLLNPLYLAGEFGVMVQPDGLMPQKTEGRFECYEDNLLPYYAGVIEYTTTFTVAHIPVGNEVLVEFAYDTPFHEAAEISINNMPPVPVLWQPRCVKIATTLLRAGSNTLKTRVYTTLIRSFEGQWFDYEQHAYRNIESA